MTEEQTTKLSREQLYDEIWEISVSGVAKKYNVPYAKLVKLCKETNIPYPPSGYWTQLNFGKPVTNTPLPESSIVEVTLPANSAPKRSKHTTKSTAVIEVRKDVKVVENLDSEVEAEEENVVTGNQLFVEVMDTPKDNQLTYRTVNGKYNTYNREKLYAEVWAKPVVDVAVKYGVSDVAIHKICKSLNVPVPPRGYWAKLRAGEKLKKTPLPKTKGITEIVGLKTFEGVKASNAVSQPLSFLSEDEREKVLLAAQQIKIPAENAQLHKKIITYRSMVKEWNKKNMRPEGTQKGLSNYNYSNRPPFLAGVISNETLPRVYRIIDALFRQVESLDGSINDDLSLQVRNERVHLEVFEAQDEVKHNVTRQEAKELLIYEDAQRHHTWASKPNIRKYDYVFSGRLRISIRKSRYFRDTDTVTIESRLGDMLIELYEESEVVRLDREAREKAQQREEEEKRLREERRIRYNDEVERTIALTNLAQDYDVACKIRVYITGLESNISMDEKTASWIDWAKKKADWFDPTIARTDELLGKREHEKNEEQKNLKKSYW
ncbi:hypothetical protein E4K67_19925 [Desulfosporosinus fructosivorans]|uniref:Uncharacterized protein n=1 Tax=Desulfosporosinus fructosivorans TaxID=2018669 RepID=A0A4Z0R3H9_9FIRM|nr:hypothetical protein [Desulfosporosinus fructosivorans]TGE36693.1 hypothetical protein E4K67_19925 [Desulfosporosinus fructosivorans]